MIGPFNDDRSNAAFWADKSKVCGFEVMIDEDRCGKCHSPSKNGINYLCKKCYMSCNDAMMKAGIDWGKR